MRSRSPHRASRGPACAPRLAVAAALVLVAALGLGAAHAAASTWYVSGTITNSTAYPASFPEYSVDCPGGTGVKSGNWIVAPPQTIPAGKSVPYKFDAPHFGEGAHMCIAYEVLATEQQEHLQTWIITADDSIAQTPWVSCRAYYPPGFAGCALSVSGKNKNVTANYVFSDCSYPLTTSCETEGDCEAANSNDYNEVCDWWIERKEYPGLAGQVLALDRGAGIVSGVAYRRGTLSYSLSGPAFVRVLVSKRTRQGLRALPPRERLRGAGHDRVRLRLGAGRYRIAVIACPASKRCSTEVTRTRVATPASRSRAFSSSP